MTNTIAGTYNTLVTLDAAIDNPTTITQAGRLADGLQVSYQNLTVVNAGSIAGSGGDGVDLLEGGGVTNQSGGAISGYNGIFGVFGGGAVTVVNAGSIAGNGIGIFLDAGGNVTNQSGGAISGYDGIFGRAAALTVVNAGSITGSATYRLGTGIDLAAGGSVTNQIGGAISGSDGIYGELGAVTVVNAGSIAGGIFGVYLNAGGSVTNQSGGTISGGTEGIYGYESAVTVVNAGTITGSRDAVYLHAGYANRLVIDPGAVFSGEVSGGNAIGAAQVSTLELASAGSAGTLSGLGTQFVDFVQLTVDAGAQWTLQATDTIEAGVTLTNAGTLSGPVTLAAGGVLSNASTGTVTMPSGTAVYEATGGATTVVNAGVIAGSDARGGQGIDLAGGGSVTNQSGGVISGAYGINVRSGALTVVNAGTITGSNYAVKFSAASANRLIADPGAVFTGNVNGGTGVLELASAAGAGTLSGLGTSITNFRTLQFDAGAAWTVSGNDSGGLGGMTITGFANGDTIDLSGFVASSDTFANNTLVLTDDSGAQDTLAIQGAFTSSSFRLSTDGSGNGTDIVICFCAGTQIGTPTGEVPVEQLQIGALVLTAHHGPRPVKWIGQGKVLATRGRRTAATPVIVRKGALADNVPNRDLHVTKAHSLYIDDVLIPVEFLVNHKTILWDDRAQEVEIYHVELDSHDVLIANGAPAESYRDDGNRWLFHNANAGWHLPPQDPYAPVLTGGPVVDAVWRRLLDRAGPRRLPPLTDDPDLHLVVDGTRVVAEERQGSVYVFRLPPSPKSVVIASREIVPAEFGIARDPRSLGVALRQVALRQGGKFTLFDAADERLTVGFHAYEADGHLRWTNGYAELPAAVLAQFDKGAEVMLHLGGATQYPDERVSSARAAA
jgi:antigen 43